MKQCLYALQGLIYELRMMSIPISGSSFIYGDNMSVNHNTSRPEPILRKKATQFAVMQSMNQLSWMSP